MHDTHWNIGPEWGFPDSLVLWLWVNGWCYPVRLQTGTVPPIMTPPAPPLALPTPLPAITGVDDLLGVLPQR